jgi:probable phosphoglycerate mutase
MPIRSAASPGGSSSLFFSQAHGETPGEWISAHCDGGARGNPGPAGYGALIQGPDGGVIAELSEFLGIRTNNYAEYSGLLGCLAWALEHGHRKLKMVSDSELMVKQIQGKYQVKSPDLKPLYEEAKRRIAKLDGFEISHALRHKNKDADRLANEAMDRGMKRGSSGDAPKASNPPARPSTPPVPIVTSQRPVVAPIAPADAMLRGFTRDGVVHLLGGARLPDGVFVKIIRE